MTAVIPDRATFDLRYQANQLDSMTDMNEVIEAIDAAAREYAGNALHRRRPADRQGNTDRHAWAIRDQRQEAAAALWLAATARLDKLWADQNRAEKEKGQ